MNILEILFLSFGILLILFGISIFLPFLSWFGRKLNSSKFSSINYNQPNSTRTASLFMGICFFIFGIFIVLASPAILNWNTSDNQDLPTKETVSPEVQGFQNPMHSGNNSSIPSIKNGINENNSIISEYKLNCPPDADGLNMRTKANLEAQIITLIPCNAIGIKDKQERYFQDGVEWFLVEYQQNTGWVAGKYLQIQATELNQNTFSPKLLTKKDPEQIIPNS
ncbi:MAG: SH3 domain-containing protein [Nostocales cyanobacterium 94392]|nr:SH3 domain-containing protein [Nostocales cyanobacterium 94392]